MSWYDEEPFAPQPAGLLRQDRLLWPRIIAWGALLFGLSLWAFFATYDLTGWLHLPAYFHYVFAIGVPPLSLLLYAVAVRRVEARQVSELRLSRAPQELAVGGVVGVAYMLVLLALLTVLGLYRVGWGVWSHQPQMFLFNSYISGVLEELWARAVILRLVGRLIGPIGGLLVSSAVFAALHLSYVPLWAAIQMMFGSALLFGLLYLVSGRLWLSIGMHTGADFADWSILGDGNKYGLLVIHPAAGASALLTGGAGGPERSVLSLIVVAAFAAAILFTRRLWKTDAATAPA